MKKHRIQKAALPQTAPGRSRSAQTLGVLGMMALAILAGAPRASANPCNYGELFDFTTNNIGSMTDIDREPVAVTVSTDGTMSSLAGGAGGVWGYNHDFLFSPALYASISPSYGHGLYVGLGANPDVVNQTLSFRFSKSMRNLAMHFNHGTQMTDGTAGRSRIFTFTDGSGAPVPIHIRKAYQSPTVLTDRGVFEIIAPNKLQATGGSGSIGFPDGITKINMLVEYPAGQAAGSPGLYSINFAQYCDDVGLLGPCTDPRMAAWSGPGPGATTSKREGRIANADGKVIGITANGKQTAPTHPDGYIVANGGNDEDGISMPYSFPQAEFLPLGGTITGPVVYSFVFSEKVSMPSLLLRWGSPGLYSFFKADGVTPLPFVVRQPGVPYHARQIDANVMNTIGGGFGNYDGQNDGNGDATFNLQFTEPTTAIVMKVTNLKGTAYSGAATVYLNCTGISTDGGGGGIDTDGDGDGVPDMIDKCPNTPPGAVVGSDGCPLPTDLSVTKTASTAVITKGVPFNYVITVTNTGAEANNVEAGDIVPNGLVINSFTASDAGAASASGQTVTGKWAIVPAGATRTLTISVTKP